MKVDAEIPSIHTPEGTAFPLGYAQLCFWFVYVALGETANVLSRVMIEGELEVSLLERAINQLIQKHEGLSVSINDWNPMQVVKPVRCFDLAYQDTSSMSDVERTETIGRAGHEFLDTPFDLAAPPLMRSKLFRIDGKSHVLVLCFPHIVADGGAVHLFRKQLPEIYERLCKGGAVSDAKAGTLQISDFVVWEREQNEIHGREAERFWRAHLEGSPYARFPETYLAKHDLIPRDELVDFPEDSFSCLADLAKTHKATVQMCLLAAIGIIIFKMTGQARFSINSVLENRGQSGTEGLIAPLLRAMPVPFILDESMSFESVLVQVRKNVLAAYEHDHCPWSIPLGILASQGWRHSPSLFSWSIKLLSRFFSPLFYKARLYPSFLADYLFMEPSPPESIWSAFFGGDRLKGKNGAIPCPVINVNILQGVFKQERTRKEPLRLQVCEMHARSDYQSSQDHATSWEDGTINFYITDTGQEKPSVRISCVCLNEIGMSELSNAVCKVVSYAGRTPGLSINSME